jgi:hypothetical protein
MTTLNIKAPKKVCNFSTNNKCTSQYGANKDCNGLDVPEFCPYKYGENNEEINKEINFTKDELYWIERACDIETSMCMNKFIEICKLEHPEKLSVNELSMLMKLSGELIDTYTLCKELRIKLEMFRKNEN